MIFSVKPLDFLLAICSVAVLILSLLLLKNNKNKALQLEVNAAGISYIFPLEIDSEYDIKGVLGISKIKIINGNALFVSSPCPNETCVSLGKISKVGQWRACMPNQVFIRIGGRR